jgi:chromosome partitioning protein
MRKLAVAMAKGGVGKTTTAVNLAHGLARKGFKVLLIDGDTQGQASKFLGVEPKFGLYEFVTGNDEKGNPVSKKDALCPCRANMWLLAGGIKLVELKNWLGEQPRTVRQSVLSSLLVPKDGTLDYLIFDCAPGWDVLSVNILMAAEEVLCPVALQGPALEGLKTFFGYLMSTQRLNPKLQLKYILPTMFDQRTAHSFEILIQLRRLFRKQICEPIHYNVRLSEAPVRGRTIFEYRASAISAGDYERLTWRIHQDGRQNEGRPRLF